MFSGVFRKINIIFVYEDIMDIFFGSSQNLTIFRGTFYAFYGLFLRSIYRMGDIFGGLLKSQIFLGVLEIPYIVLG